VTFLCSPAPGGNSLATPPITPPRATHRQVTTRSGFGFRTLPRAGDFSLLAQRKVHQKKWLAVPKANVASAIGAGIFRQDILVLVEKRPASLPAALRVSK